MAKVTKSRGRVLISKEDGDPRSEPPSICFRVDKVCSVALTSGWEGKPLTKINFIDGKSHETVADYEEIVKLL